MVLTGIICNNKLNVFVIFFEEIYAKATLYSWVASAWINLTTIRLFLKQYELIPITLPLKKNILKYINLNYSAGRQAARPRNTTPTPKSTPATIDTPTTHPPAILPTLPFTNLAYRHLHCTVVHRCLGCFMIFVKNLNFLVLIFVNSDNNFWNTFQNLKQGRN